MNTLKCAMDYVFEVVVFLGIAALVIGLVVLMLHIESLRCHKYAELNKVNHDYSVMSGCMVQNKNKAWVPLGQIRGGL